jgi:hypothetical protein
VVLEINRFNLELNLTPAPLAGRPFAAMASELDQDRFADHFNAVQLATAPVLAVAGNSPTFLGHRLWQETRVALFKQAVHDRDASGRSSRRLARVAFGTGWIRSGPMELLEESVRLHEPVLPVLGPEAPLERLEDGAVPALVGTRVDAGQVGSVTGLVGAADGLGGFLPPIVMGLVFQATGDYAIGLMLLSDVALAGLVFTAWRLGR